MLMAMPAAEGLFHKAVVESGSFTSISARGHSQDFAAAVMKRLDVRDVKALQEVPAAALVRAGDAAKADMPKPPPGEIALFWGPTADGHTFEGGWASTAPAISAHIPLLVGSNLNEYSPSLGNPQMEDITEDRAKAAAKGQGIGDAAWARFRARKPAAKPVEILSEAVSARFRNPCLTQASAKAGQRAAPVFLYRFDYNPTSVLDGRVRAFHCAEMAYALDNVDRCLNATGGTDEARALAAKMSGAWLAFAGTGDPNHPGLPHWPPVATAGPVANMVFDRSCRVEMISGNPE